MAGPDGGPYVGLRHYATGDAGRFFGRAAETRELTTLAFGNRLVVVYGPSGVGKTSLIRAGVLAGIDRETAQVLPVGRPPQASAFPTALIPEYNPYSFAVLSSWAPDRSPGAIPGLSVSQFVRSLPVEYDRYDDEVPLIAVIDQFEDVFIDVPQWQGFREEFLAELAQAVQDVSRLHLVIAVREDLVGEILPYESGLSARHRTRFRLRALDPEAALEAVTGPLRSTGRSFASGVAEELVERLRTTTITNAVGEQRTVQASMVEPVNLQIVCSSLWRDLPDEVSVITAEQLQDHGDVEAALTRFCAEAVNDVARREGLAPSVLWEWLERTFITDLGTRGTAYEGIAATGGMPNTVARAFEEHRILHAEQRSGSVWFELLGDGLIEPIKSGSRQAERAGPDTSTTAGPSGYLRMAETALADGMLTRAEEYARRAAQAGQNEPRTLAEAESFLAKLALDQARAAVGQNRADALYDSAEQHYLTAARLFEVEQDPWAVGRLLASLGRLYAERRRHADAVEAFQGALQRLRGDLATQLDLARVLVDAGQPQAALAAYGQVLVAAPETVDALVGRAAVMADHGDPDLALADLDNAVRLRPELAEDPGVVSLRARAHARTQRQR